MPSDKNNPVILCVSLLALLAVACTTHNTQAKKILDFDTFRLTTPQNWKKLTRRGIDSYVGGLTNSVDTIWFDYGSYDVDWGINGDSSAFAAKDTINGYEATLVKHHASGKLFIGMQIAVIKATNQFSIWAENIKEEKTVLAIYKSLIRPGSDSLKNPAFTSDNFTQLYQSPRKLFYNNCACCHSINKKTTGPPLSEVIPFRNMDWVHNYITRRGTMAKDSLQKQLEKEYEWRCNEFPDMTRTQTEALYLFIVKQQLSFR